MAGRTKPRRGVLLLIVLSLLVLFLLVGLSFLVSASQFNRLAKSASRTDNTGMPGAKLADAALLQLVRGTSNPYSAIHGHSLLEDLYGRDYIVISTDGNVSSPGTQQIQRVRINLSDAKNYRLGQPLAEDVVHGPQELRDDYYNGCVLTFLNGTAKGMSTRVLAYKPNATPPQIVFQGIAAHNPANGEFEKPQKTNGEPLRFIINGRAFNGTGAGYNPVSGYTDLRVGRVPLALFPNYKSYRESTELHKHLQTNMKVSSDGLRSRVVDDEDLVAFNYGGLDESWDGVDFQNFFLSKSADLQKTQTAAILESATDLSTQQSELLSYIRKTGGSTPSFHRPYLMSYLARTASRTNAASYATARPSAVHHPAFTGSNPEFDPIKGPWDVDANGDGIPDSVWIDAGLAPVSGPDGRLYKPLVAAHVVDLDGRININTAGSLELAKIGMNPQMTHFEASGAVVPVAGAMLPITQRDRSSFGSGYGPAEIASGLTDWGTANLLRSRYTGHRKDDEQRNVESPFDPDTGSWYSPSDQPRLQYSETAGPGVGPGGGRRSADFSDDDAMFARKPVPWIPDYFGANGLPSFGSGFGQHTDQSERPGPQTSLDTGYGSPPDPHGRLIPYLDAFGNIIWAGGDSAGRYDNVDDPYESNVLGNDQHDNLYDLADLEALHRFDKPSSETQSRAAQRLLEGGVEPTSLQNYTTHSFSIPAPPTLASGSFRGLARTRAGSTGEGLRRSMREVFAAHILRVRFEGKLPVTYAEAFAQAERIMAPELLRGEKIDLNRVLVPNKQGEFPGVNERLSKHTAIEREQLLNEKEKFARHLFNLLMLVSDEGHNESFRSFRDSHVHRLAQWAINVVDFGDADSVMTRFRYDVNPFNEIEVFDAQGNIVDTTELREVWGMEYPEFVLTETLAFHDLRAEDSPEGGGTLAEGDPDLDSNIPPEGAAFVELLSMAPKRPESQRSWKYVSRRAPEDLHRDQTGRGLIDTRPWISNGIFAAPTASKVHRKPLWRLAISDVHRRSTESPTELLANPWQINSFEPTPGPFERPGLDETLDLKLNRFVWFAGGRGAEPFTWRLDDDENEDNTFLTGGLDTPGRYLVIGPEAQDGMVEVGLTKDKAKTSQRISLLGERRFFVGRGDFGGHRRVANTRLRPVPPAVERAVSNNGSPVTNYFGDGATTQAGNSFNISEPIGGYPSESSPEPFDAESVFGVKTQTKSAFRTVFLQRLANPSLPWNPHEGKAGYDPTLPVNPYRTIDWMPMDLTIFNSFYEDNDPANHRDFFRSREKSGVPRSRVSFRTEDDPFLGADFFNVWSAHTWQPIRLEGAEHDRPIGEAVTQIEDPTLFKSLNRSTNTNVVHSLGWLNRSFDFVGVANDGLGHYQLDSPLGETPLMPIPPGQNPGTTRLPPPTYPSLVWLNRPYANPYELLLVPACSSSALSAEYTVSSSASPYSSRGGAFVGYGGLFGHLLNFFNVTGTNGGGGVFKGADYFRIFDFVTVPSRFRDTQTWYDSNQNTWAKLLWNNDPTRLDATSQIGLSTLPASVSKFREPGKINLNTATDRAWDAVGFDSLLRSWDVGHDGMTQGQRFERSMAGGVDRIQVETSAGSLSGRYPSGDFPAEYPSPLRAGVTGDLMPRMRGLPLDVAYSGIHATLLRRTFSGAEGEGPILGRYSLNRDPDSPAQAVAAALQNRKTNAYFRFRDMIKLGSSVTSQSNVYAIWVTIGYFEIEPNVGKGTGEVFAVDAAHPDGYRFGMEMGSDVGQVTRHRAFYIVDRSIPVAFEPGKNHNVEKAVLLRRHLE